jgi:hypothetical protein
MALRGLTPSAIRALPEEEQAFLMAAWEWDLTERAKAAKEAGRA